MKQHSPNFKQLTVATLFSTAILLTGVPAQAQEQKQEPATTAESVKANLKNSWQEGIVEGAYLFNTSLNPLDIDVDVNAGKATLTGYVDSSVAKSLAEEIALSIDGISSVDNQLKVDPKQASAVKEKGDSLMADVSDAAITVKVKSKLLANGDVSGLKINVDTDHKEVTLTGTVNSSAERDLVYYITRNTKGVKSVVNDLEVEASAS